MTNTTFASGKPEAVAIERLAAIMAMPEAQGLEGMAMLLFGHPENSVASIRDMLRLARQTGPVSAAAQPERARAETFLKASGMKIDHGWGAVMAGVNASRGAAKADAPAASADNHGWVTAIANINASRA